MLERAESVYGGTKSLYNAPCQAPKSPGFVTAPSSRTVNLNRSQSVYAKAPPSGRNQQQQPQQQPILQSAQSTYLTARNVDLIRTESIYAARPPQQPIYGARRTAETEMREPLYGRTLQDRSKPECYQLEPIYGTRRHPETIITASIEQQQQQRPQAENLYGRSIQQNMDNSSVPISPSDTSKDSAYGSVHHHHPNAGHHPHDWSAGSSYQPVGNGHVYAQKFRTDLMSPTGGQHSPSSQNMTATPGSAFHSPVQY